MRILITGSRDWADKEAIANAIEQYADGGEITLVHGACSRGADKLADELGWIYGVAVERHPADWVKHGKRAGFVRNAEMVALGADVCLAFIRNGSKGASMTADLAEKAGIPTFRITQQDPA